MRGSLGGLMWVATHTNVRGLERRLQHHKQPRTSHQQDSSNEMQLRSLTSFSSMATLGAAAHRPPATIQQQLFGRLTSFSSMASATSRPNQGELASGPLAPLRATAISARDDSAMAPSWAGAGRQVQK